MEDNEIMEGEQLFDENEDSGLLTDEEISEPREPEREPGGEPGGEPNDQENREPDPGQQQEQQEPERYTFEVNGQQMSMTMAELQSAAARVRQADQIIRQQNQQRNSPEMQLISRLAAQNGMSTAQYVQAVEQQMERQKIQQMVQSGVPEGFAKRLIELEQKERAREQAEQQAARKADTDRDFRDFVAAYPDVKEFPPEVAQAIRQGQKPLAAYQAYENRQLKAQLAAIRQNEENRKKTPGSMAGDGPAPDVDAFLSGFGS